MKQHQLKLYLNFYKSTLLINWLTSGVISVFFFSVKTFAFMTLTAGFVIALLYKEFRKQKEYYFYFNAGINKRSLIIGNFLLHFILAGLLFFISEA